MEDLHPALPTRERGAPPKAGEAPLLMPALPACTRVVLRFSSGAAGRPAHRRLLAAFNAGDHAEAGRILEEIAHALTPFQASAVRWLLAAATGSAAEPGLRREAERSAMAPRERAAICEDAACVALLRGRPEEARRICEDALALFPAAQGLWINLLVALDRLGEDAAIEALLERLPALFDLRQGALGRYLMCDPAFEAAMGDGG